MIPTPRLRLVDYLLYSYVWIAVAALLLLQQTRLFLVGRPVWDALAALLFFGTLALYALHRLVGLWRGAIQEGGQQFPLRGAARLLPRFSLAVGLPGAAISYALLPGRVQLCLLIPALLALGYALPLPGGRRLRDYHYLKIFLVAIVWSWVTVAVPAMAAGRGAALPLALMVFERLAFCFAIALGFDIRDMAVDRAARVQTLPTRLGRRRAQMLAFVVLFLSLVAVGLNVVLATYSPTNALALLVAHGYVGMLVGLARADRHDYYFSGLLDGAMILSFLVVYLFR